MEVARIVGERLDQEKVVIEFYDEGRETSDSYVIASIPSFYALPFYRKSSEEMAGRSLLAMPETVVGELMKYVMHDGVWLESAAEIDRHCRTAEVVMALSAAVWDKNFGFYAKRKFPESGQDQGSAACLLEYTGIDPLFATIIHHGHASLWDLKHRYTLEEAYDIWESDFVPEENESRLRKLAIDEAKLKKGIYK